jgi:hypothetical protein
MNWRDLGDTGKTAFVATLKNTPLASEAAAIYAIVKPYSILYLAHLKQESNFGREGVAATGGHNPTGLRPRGGDGFMRFATWLAAAIEWLDRVSDPHYAYADTTTVAEYVHTYAPSSDGNDEAGYVAAIMAAHAKYGRKPRMGEGMYTVAGLNHQIKLPVPLIVDLIPPSQTNQRPGLVRQMPGYWVQHETANEAAGADAAMHNRWLHAGADGSQLSFHFCVDDGVIYQMIPINEVTWQAADGAGAGNMSGISCELCVNADGDEALARHNAVALCGAICSQLGLGIDRIRRHWDFNAADPDRHHCPDHMMRDGYWPIFVANAVALATTTKMPPGIGLRFLQRHFAGHASHIVTIDGTEYSYNPDGPVSQAWLAHCLELVAGKKVKTNPRWWPRLVGVRQAGAHRVYEFKDGWTFTYTGS